MRSRTATIISRDGLEGAACFMVRERERERREILILITSGVISTPPT